MQLQGSWMETFDPATGLAYYYNRETGETKWAPITGLDSYGGYVQGIAGHGHGGGGGGGSGSGSGNGRFKHRVAAQSARPCRHGMTCIKFGCHFTHPQNRPSECADGGSCQSRSSCMKLHPKLAAADGLGNGKGLCRHGAVCVKFGCTFGHPDTRPADCAEGGSCAKGTSKCSRIHPKGTPSAPQNSADSSSVAGGSDGTTTSNASADADRSSGSDTRGGGGVEQHVGDKSTAAAAVTDATAAPTATTNAAATTSTNAAAPTPAGTADEGPPPPYEMRALVTTASAATATDTRTAAGGDGTADGGDKAAVGATAAKAADGGSKGGSDAEPTSKLLSKLWLGSSPATK
jgi:hypothetical protein